MPLVRPKWRKSGLVFHPGIRMLDKGFSHLAALVGNASRKHTSLPCAPCPRSCFPHWAWGTPCSALCEGASRQGSRSRLGWRWGYPSWQSWPNTSSYPWTDPPAKRNSNIFNLYRACSLYKFEFVIQIQVPVFGVVILGHLLCIVKVFKVWEEASL